MNNGDINVPTGPIARNSNLAEFERTLETLIVLAHSQGRNFLAYLLVMALMHVTIRAAPEPPTEASWHL